MTGAPWPVLKPRGKRCAVECRGKETVSLKQIGTGNQTWLFGKSPVNDCTTLYYCIFFSENHPRNFGSPIDFRDLEMWWDQIVDAQGFMAPKETSVYNLAICSSSKQRMETRTDGYRSVRSFWSFQTPQCWNCEFAFRMGDWLWQRLVGLCVT